MRDKYHVELTPELINRAQAKLDHILNEGSVRPGVSEKFDANEKPAWYDEERYKKAAQILRDYQVAVLYSSLAGLFFLLQQPIDLIPILATEQSKNVSKIFNRFVNTIMHFNLWYEDDPFDKNSKGYKSQLMVKRMHENVSKLMSSKVSVYDFVKKMLEEQNKENGDVDKKVEEEEIIKIIKRKDRVWVSQADMAITQWVSYGLMVLEPRSVGVHGGSKEKLVEIAYVWRVLSWKIGIDDEFNLFDELDFDLLYAICKLILEQEYIPIAESAANPTGLRMTRSMMIGLHRLIKSATWASFVKYWYKKLNINCYKLNQPISTSNKYTFFEMPTKNMLTEEDRKLMLKNGYNDKYIVPNPHIPFEELRESTFADKMACFMYTFEVNIMHKSQFMRDWSRKKALESLADAKKNKKKHIDTLKKHDEANTYPSCPFAGSAIQSEYLEYDDVGK